MKKLISLKDKHDAHLSSIIASKTGERKGRLETLAVDLKTHYKTYSDNFATNSLESLSELIFSETETEDLLHCYTSSTNSLSALKKEVRRAQKGITRGLCPYCEVGLDKSIDHYLPKDTFPEYCVHALNLFPCCTTCNSEKGKVWLKGGKRVIINFYLDDIPDEKFLSVKISWRKIDNIHIPSATYSISKPATVKKEDFSIIESHFDRLKLLEKYRRYTNLVYADALNATQGVHTTEQAIVNFSKIYLGNIRKNYGHNTWRYCFLEALFSEKNFLEQCLEV